MRHPLLRDLYALAAIALLWQALSMLLATPALPSPWSVGIRLAAILPGELWQHCLVSLARILAALALGLLLGLPLGIAMGAHRRIDHSLSPLVWLLYPVPKIALLPVFFLVLGLGESAKIALISVIVVFPLIIAGRDGVRQIPPSLLLSARSLGLGRRQWYRHLILPAVLPAVWSALRICIGIALSVLFFAENFATERGLGYFIMNSWAVMRYPDLYAGIVALSLVGLGLFRLIEWLEKTTCPWLSQSGAS